MDVFKSEWIPDHGMTDDDNVDDYVKTIQFGEGAVQLQKKVLGSLPRVFNCTFSGDLPKLKEINDFVRANQGKRFLWTPPEEIQQIIVYCTKRSRNTNGVSGSISLTLKQVVY